MVFVAFNCVAIYSEAFSLTVLVVLYNSWSGPLMAFNSVVVSNSCQSAVSLHFLEHLVQELCLQVFRIVLFLWCDVFIFVKIVACWFHFILLRCSQQMFIMVAIIMVRVVSYLLFVNVWTANIHYFCCWSWELKVLKVKKGVSLGVLSEKCIFLFFCSLLKH